MHFFQKRKSCLHRKTSFVSQHADAQRKCAVCRCFRNCKAISASAEGASKNFRYLAPECDVITLTLQGMTAPKLSSPWDQYNIAYLPCNTKFYVQKRCPSKWNEWTQSSAVSDALWFGMSQITISEGLCVNCMLVQKHVSKIETKPWKRRD